MVSEQEWLQTGRQLIAEDEQKEENSINLKLNG